MTIEQQIQDWKRERDAVILAHYYVAPEVQEIADYVGDSFYLSKVALDLPQQTIVFCGVAFMGESAKLLNEKKTVLMPDPEADCPMAHMARPEEIRKIREREEDLAVVCYINSTAALKACADVCVTSANALDVVRALPNRKILMVPDQNLAHFVAQQVPEKEFLFHPGCCPVHQEIRLSEVLALKEALRRVPVLAHPECAGRILCPCGLCGQRQRDHPLCRRTRGAGVHHLHGDRGPAPAGAGDPRKGSISRHQAPCAGI